MDRHHLTTQSVTTRMSHLAASHDSFVPQGYYPIRFANGGIKVALAISPHEIVSFAQTISSLVSKGVIR
jgi:hypothetical protein